MSNELALTMVGASSVVIGGVAGLGARLAWHARAHEKAGRVVQLKVSSAAPTCDDPWDGSDRLILIKVFNKERAPIIVTKLGISLGPSKADKNVFVPRPQPRLMSVLPAVVMPCGTPAQFGVPADELRTLQAESGIPFADMRPWVELGDGRRVRSQCPVPHA